jgi:hypothetical protein
MLQHHPKTVVIRNKLNVNSTSLCKKVKHDSWKNRLQRMNKYRMPKAAFQCQTLEREEM